MKHIFKLGLLATPFLLLMACGGGEADSELAAGGTTTSTVAQGRWVGAGATQGHVAIAVPASAGVGNLAVDTLWVLSPDVATLHKLKINGQATGTVSGQVFALGSATAEPVANASYAVQTTAGTQLSVKALPGGTFSFSHSSDMAAALGSTQANGSWQASLGDVQVSWTVQDLVLKGTSTSGCTYSGQLASVSGMGIYKVQFTETCADVALGLSGVATMNAATDRLTVVAATDNEAQATALLFAKAL